MTNAQPKTVSIADAASEFQDAIYEMTTCQPEETDAKAAALAEAAETLNRRIRASFYKGGQAALEAANDNEPLGLINPARWQDAPLPVREWYLDDLVPMRQVTIMNGDGGVGKSLLKLQIAAAGALQCETLGIRPLPGRVLYVGAEDEADEFHRRLVDIVDAHSRRLSDLEDFRLLPLADRDALLSVPDKAGVMQPTPLWAKIEAEARAFLPKLIVLDTSADLFGGDEIKRGQVRQFISMLRKLAIEIGCAIVLLSHPSLDGIRSGTGTSGSTAWSNSVRSRLYLTRPDGKDEDPDVRVLTTMKINYGKTGGQIRMRWQEGAFVLDDGKPPAAAGLMKTRSEKVFRALLSQFNRNGQNVSDVSGTNYAPAKMSNHTDAGGVSKAALAGAMQRLIDRGEVRIVMDGPKSRQRKRLILATEDYGAKD